MRINHNISSMITQGSLFQTNRSMGKNLEKLSTGLRINRASDDAAGLGVSENLRTQVKGTAQAKKNALDGIAALNIAEGAANEITAVLQRMRELAVQSANDTLTSTERAYTNAEFEQLTLEIDRIAEVTNYNGQQLISTDLNSVTRFGGAQSRVLQIDANDVADVDTIEVDIIGLSSGAADLNVVGNDLTSQTNATTAITSLDTAIDLVNTMRADVGAIVNRLEHAINNLDVSNSNQQAAESLIRDVDFANETADFTKNQILTQSATAMLAQANQVPQGVLQLLRG
jgi:flagellin